MQYDSSRRLHREELKMSQGPMSTSPSKGGRMPASQQGRPSIYSSRPYQPQLPQSAEGGSYSGGIASLVNRFGGQQRGQFGGQVINRPAQSVGGKGGQSRQPVQIQPYPMPSPGGKGRSYQMPSIPTSYGQTTPSTERFAGYGQPADLFAFNNPHYRPYDPYSVNAPQNYGNMDYSQYAQNRYNTGQLQGPMRKLPLAPVQEMPNAEPRPRDGGGGFGPEQLNYRDYYNPNQFRVIDPYGEGGDLYGQPRQTFPSPYQPTVPQTPIQPLPAAKPSPAQMESSATSLWNQAQASLDKGDLNAALKFRNQYEDLTGTTEPLYGLKKLDGTKYNQVRGFA